MRARWQRWPWRYVAASVFMVCVGIFGCLSNLGFGVRALTAGQYGLAAVDLLIALCAGLAVVAVIAKRNLWRRDG